MSEESDASAGVDLAVGLSGAEFAFANTSDGGLVCDGELVLELDSDRGVWTVDESRSRESCREIDGRFQPVDSLIFGRSIV